MKMNDFNTDAAVLIEEAADKLRTGELKWVTDSYGDDDNAEACGLGALNVAAWGTCIDDHLVDVDPDREFAAEIAVEALDDVVLDLGYIEFTAFNDATDRTVEEVIDKMMEAAKFLRNQ
jgi:hypothetical protein